MPWCARANIKGIIGLPANLFYGTGSLPSHNTGPFSPASNPPSFIRSATTIRNCPCAQGPHRRPTTRLKEIRGLFARDDAETREEAAVLDEWLELSNQETALKKKLKDAEAALDAEVYAQYPKLTEDDVKTLVVDDKWLAVLEAAIHGEMERISQALTQRVKELAERYEPPMPQLASRVAELEAKVHRHLERMGFRP